jgi:hypothetical protein
MMRLHQQNQATMGALLQGAAAEQMRQDAERRNRPIVPPIRQTPTYNTQCTRDYFGNLNCTTQ